MAFNDRLNPTNIVGVDVYLEHRKSRSYVGRLTSVRADGLMEIASADQSISYVFTYDDKYLYRKTAIPLGPDLPLTKKLHTSPHVFRTLNDRIPSTKNPSYQDYCEATGISIKEKNPLVLLSTIGRRGPSSFVFEPVYDDAYSIEDYKQFREALTLTIREFAALFDFTAATLTRMEAHRAGKDALKRIALYDRFPEVALSELTKRGGVLHEHKKQFVSDSLYARINRQPTTSTGTKS